MLVTGFELWTSVVVPTTAPTWYFIFYNTKLLLGSPMPQATTCDHNRNYTGADIIILLK